MLETNAQPGTVQKPPDASRPKSCKLCRATSLVPENARFDLVRCTSCGLIFAATQFTPAQLSETYAKLYSMDSGHSQRFSPDNYEVHLGELADLKNRGTARLPFNKRHMIREVMRHKPRVVYELGAGVGIVAAEFRRRNIKYRGVEFDAGIAASAHELGLEISQGEHRDLLRFGESADAVLAFEVIEHVPDIAECLTSLRNVLADNGVLGITVPNYDKRLNGSDPEAILQHPPPIHLNFWTATTLRTTLELAGFAPIFIRERRRPYLAVHHPVHTAISYLRYIAGRHHGPVLLCVARKLN